MFNNGTKSSFFLSLYIYIYIYIYIYLFIRMKRNEHLFIKKSINSSIRNVVKVLYMRERERETETETERDRGLLWLTHCWYRHIQRPAYFMEIWHRTGSQPESHPVHLWVNVSKHWLLSDWLYLTHSGRKILYYIFSGRPHIFLSHLIHVIHFGGPLPTLRH